MKGLERFESINHKMRCSLCGKEIQRYSKVNIRATDPLSRYKGSARPMVHTYRFDLCPEHFDKFKETLDKFIEDSAQEDVLDLDKELGI